MDEAHEWIHAKAVTARGSALLHAVYARISFARSPSEWAKLRGGRRTVGVRRDLCTDRELSAGGTKAAEQIPTWIARYCQQINQTPG